MNKQLFAGKSKTIFASEDTSKYLVKFRDDVTAMNAKYHATPANKGRWNCKLNHFFMGLMHQNDINTHYIEQTSDDSCLVHKLNMVGIEVVCRNRSAGSICARYGIEKNITFEKPLLEFFIKNDELGDPMISPSGLIALNLANQRFIKLSQALALKVNTVLSEYFSTHNLILVDFKLEFGWLKNELVLGDELTPDSMRIWDNQTLQSYDKDIFRTGKNGENLVSAYNQLIQRLGIN